MDDKKISTGTPTENPEEPVADAMAFSSSAKKEREKEEEERRRAEQEEERQFLEQRRAERAAAQHRGPEPPENHWAEELESNRKEKKASLKKQDKIKRRSNKKKFSEKKDPYYGLELKPLEVYQKEYEETLSFKPVRPEEQPSEMTGTFTYLFDGSKPAESDPELSKKVQKMHEERRRRVKEVVHKSGSNDVAKEDIYSITTAISLDEIRKEAAKKGVTVPTERFTASGTNKNDRPSVKEPESIPQKPEKEVQSSPPVQEPQERPQPVKAVQEPQTEMHCAQSGEPVGYRPTGTPVHIVNLQDLITPIFNESRGYPKSISPSREQPVLLVQTAKPVETEINSDAEVAAKPAVSQPEEEHDQAERPKSAPVVPFRQKDETAEPLETKPEKSAHVSDLFVAGATETEPEQPPAAEIPVPAVDKAVPPEQTSYRLYGEAARAMVQDITSEESEEKAPEKPRRKILHKMPVIQPVAQTQKTEQTDDTTSQPEKPVQAPVPVEDQLDDYNKPEDAAPIFHQLGGDLRELMLRLTVTGICGMIEAIFGCLGEYGLFGLRPINITVYLICNLIFLSIAVGFCGVTVLNGLKALVKLRANADSGVAVASIIGMMQSIASLFYQNTFAHGELHLYSVIICAALFLNTLGKWTLVRRVNKNFHYITSPDKKYSVEKFNDHNTALQMAEGVTLDSPEIAYQQEADSLKHFLRLSYSDDPSDRSSQFLAPVLFCASLVLFLVMLLLIQPYNVNSALTAFAAATCVSVPIMNMLSVNLPLTRISKVAAQCGGMVIGFPAVQYFADTNAVMVDAQDLFPKGSVILNGIKTFGSAQMDDAIVDAAALMHAAGGPLSSLFGQIIRSRQEAMPKVENVQYDDGMGISGWVGGRRVFIGNRRLMSHHNITPPSENLEAKYLQGGKQIAYLSVSGELMAMFIVSYRADRHRTVELQRMEDNGISLIVRSNDPNVTAPFISALFGLDVHTVRVLPERLGQVYESLGKQPEKETNALMATNGRPSTMMRLITACARQRANISIAVVLQNVGAILGFVLVAFLCCQKGMQQVNTLSMVLYELFWVLAIWLVPKLRRP